MKQVFIAALFFLITGNISAQNLDIERQTFVYEDTLALDIFYPKQKSDELRPLLIYVHGGGFSGGNRGGGIGYCDYFAKKGWVTATISYHLTMKGQSFSCGQAVENKINTLLTAAQNVNQATAFLLEKSKQFNIDPSKVVIAGSSAGAEAVLQAAYWKKSQKDILSDEFKYAGVVSMAGAVLDQNWITADTAIPTALFHGTCDPLVPFATAAHHYCSPVDPGFMMLFGSHTIADKLRSVNRGFYFVSSCGGGHEWAGRPMTDEYRYMTEDFLENDVLQKKTRQIHIQLKHQMKDCQPEFDFCGR